MHLAKAVHALGWRATFELLDQLARTLDEAAVDKLLSRFAKLDLGLLDALGADRLPLSPIRVIGR